MLAPKRESLDTIIKKIQKNQILLPDFQRQFVWTDADVQCKLVASVLTKMPLGSILLLQAENATEYACKIIGSKVQLAEENIPSGQVEFLLDGQQRMTVLANVFSDAIFRLSDAGNLTAPAALKRRFFLKIPKLNNKEAQDLFGFQSLHFPLLQPTSDDPQFLTGDILPYIYVKPFHVTKDQDKCYNPYNESKLKITETETFCTFGEDKFYYIPLFLLIENGETNINSNSLSNILSIIATQVLTTRMNEFNGLIEQNETNKLRQYIEEHVHKDVYDPYFNKDCFTSGDGKEIGKEFKRVLEMQVKTWSANMLQYLQSCISQIDLSQIILENSQRGRAIDIYENLNRGGVSLDIFDLLMARVAQVTKGRFYDRLIRNISKGDNYPAHVVNRQTKKDLDTLINAGHYHASERMGCYDEKKNEIPRMYLESFLNVLSLRCYVPDFTREQPGVSSPYSVDIIKRQKKLELTATQIDDNCEQCCEYLDRACFFFQARCGLRYLKEINYVLMLPAVAYIFSDDQCYNNDKVFDLLEGWYWSSIFSGTYDRDQNQTMINDLRHLVDNVLDIMAGTNPNIEWMRDRRNRVLAEPNFSSEDFLLFNDPDSDDYPKQVITSGICQYYLSCEYQDLVMNGSSPAPFLTVFSLVADNLQQHHTIPLGSTGTIMESTKQIRKDRRHILNSPLNMMYISDKANQDISSRSLSEYARLLPNGARLQNLGFSDTDISSLSDDAAIRDALQKRFKSFKAKLNQEIDGLLN